MLIQLVKSLSTRRFSHFLISTGRLLFMTGVLDIMRIPNSANVSTKY